MSRADAALLNQNRSTLRDVSAQLAACERRLASMGNHAHTPEGTALQQTINRLAGEKAALLRAVVATEAHYD